MILIKNFFFLTTMSLLISGCAEDTVTVDASVYTDSLYKVISANRTNYTKLIVQRLSQGSNSFLSADEHWQEKDNGIPLPAQMFRLGSELVAEENNIFSYSLLSTWPINDKNNAVTDAEIKGIKFISDNIGMNFYTTEYLGSDEYYTAIYPDIAISKACVDCHNNHKDTPKSNFKLGDVMGAVVIRVKL